MGGVGNRFPTNYRKPYTGNGVTMHLSDVSYIFVAMWTCGLIKKYFENIKYVYIYIFTKKLFSIKTATFPQHISVGNQRKPSSLFGSEDIR